jgi:transposase-like protein
VHRNARLTPQGRLLLCQRIESGWPVAQVAAVMGISRDRASVWWRRYQEEGVSGLEDRSSRLLFFGGPDGS